MNKLYAALLLLALCCLSFVYSEPAYADNSANNGANTANHPNTLLADLENDARSVDGGGDGSNYDKRVERYAFGLGRRAYTYTNNGNGVKRLPVYNFGLGKRARPYSFGLGKRAEYDEDQYSDGDYERALNSAYMDEKRNRPYSFGLGKREPMEDVDRRGYPNRYGFGLGRR